MGENALLFQDTLALMLLAVREGELTGNRFSETFPPLLPLSRKDFVFLFSKFFFITNLILFSN